MSEPLIIFQAVNNESDKDLFLQKLLKQQELIYLKDKTNAPLVLKPESRGPGFSIICSQIQGSNLVPNKMSRATIHVSIEGETYYFDTIPELQAQSFKLPLLNLFHIQKRKNFRLVLPIKYEAQFIFSTLNKAPAQIPCRLVDINTDGCGIEASVQNAQFNVNDQLEGAIYLGHRPPIAIHGYIKNIRMKTEDNLTLGVAFKHTSNTTEGLIVSALADLQRELYFRKSG